MGMVDFFWYSVNSFAWLGWIWIAWCAWDDTGKVDWKDRPIIRNVMRWNYGVSVGLIVLQVICIVEVLRMIIGNLKGNWILGVILHFIRCFMMTCVLPHIGEDLPCRVVLYVWAATEFCRYPYLMTGNAKAAILRYTAPIILFPLGGGSELYAMYLVDSKGLLTDTERMIGMVVAATTIFGGVYAEYLLIKKGISVISAGGKTHPAQAALEVSKPKKERSD
eukprot:TRINITY_DN82618_c0_g1_i1.p1 TRINITY_DN82618_c0_g1~~TRINITY_DN82618_c0_g1_i1.p1  ORF type:complete len:221 (+),score=31.46 TRINITY_DN82618_c0_g1_i1:90-752(+)